MLKCLIMSFSCSSLEGIELVLECSFPFISAPTATKLRWSMEGCKTGGIKSCHLDSSQVIWKASGQWFCRLAAPAHYNSPASFSNYQTKGLFGIYYLLSLASIRVAEALRKAVGCRFGDIAS